MTRFLGLLTCRFPFSQVVIACAAAFDQKDYADNMPQGFLNHFADSLAMPVVQCFYC
jgi:hypothetical protein